MLTEQQTKELYDNYIDKAIMGCRVQYFYGKYGGYCVNVNNGYTINCHCAIAIGKVLGISREETTKRIHQATMQKTENNAEQMEKCRQLLKQGLNESED